MHLRLTTDIIINMNKKYMRIVISIIVFIGLLVTYLEPTMGGGTVLDIPIMVGCIFVSAAVYYWLKGGRSLSSNNPMLWKYWLIGMVSYILSMWVIMVQPKEVLLSKKYLYGGKGVEKDEDESLYWADIAYKNSDAYIDGYTVAKKDSFRIG